MKKIKIYVFFLFILINFNVYANDSEFNEWKKNFKLIALEKGVSLNIIESTIDKSIFLKNVINMIDINQNSMKIPKHIFLKELIIKK